MDSAVQGRSALTWTWDWFASAYYLFVVYFILVIEYEGYDYGYDYGYDNGYVYGYVVVWPSRFSSGSSVLTIDVIIEYVTYDYILIY